MHNFSALILVVIPVFAYGQNLIENPSFERYFICPDTSEQFVGYVKNWSSFFSTPDYLSTCDYYPQLSTEGKPPRTGDGLVLCKWLSYLADYEREYIHGELSEPMEAGKQYYLEYYAYTLSSIGTAQFHAHFTSSLIDSVPMNGILPLEPHIENQNGIIIERDWVRIAGCYQAEGGESYVILGNFNSNEETDTVHLRPYAQTHLVLIDDVSLYAFASLIPEDLWIVEGQGLPDLPISSLEYHWNDSLLNTNVFSFENPGHYIVQIHMKECGYIGSFNVYVEPCDKIELFEYGDITVCIFEQIEFSDDYMSHVVYTVRDSALEYQTWQANELGQFGIFAEHEYCEVMDTLYVEVLPCADTVINIDNCFYIPNAFSPDGNGINDEFEIISNGCDVINYNIQIYNRWGGVLFESSNITDTWTGDVGMDAASAGVYIYQIKVAVYTERGISKFTIAGDLTLIR